MTKANGTGATRGATNNAGGKAVTPSNPAEGAVFGDVGNMTAGATNIRDDKQIQEKPESGNIGDTTEMVSIPQSAFQEILERLNTLETEKGSATRQEESEIFDPLATVKEGHRARIAYLYNEETGANDLVLAYKTRKLANGQEKETWIEKDEKNGELRTRCSIICQRADGSQYERTNIDYVYFLEQIEVIEAPIKKRIDVGGRVKQEYTIQRVWNGKTLAPTPVRVQTGYIEQKFEYEIEVNGTPVHFKQNVINIK